MRAAKFLTQLVVIGRKTLGRALRRSSVDPTFEVVSAPSARRCAFDELEVETDSEIVLLRGSCFTNFERDGDGDDGSDCATIVADIVYGAEVSRDAGSDIKNVKGGDVDLEDFPSRSQALAMIDTIARLQREAQPHVNSEVDSELFEGIQPAFLTLMHCGGAASRQRRVRAPAVTVDPDDDLCA
ncbi:hypothetical protein AURDEDRAFT_114225 [Auricularia subglabra TFB-10046 SS5]|nr:hypothetical protein AURDEDRAFT_114225 [Auricularia subglabra TFB-10046 SS5]